ncbi:MAG: hypothetical protein R2827_14805 [Bdellovibrionales bacterium]
MKAKLIIALIAVAGMSVSAHAAGNSDPGNPGECPLRASESPIGKITDNTRGNKLNIANAQANALLGITSSRSKQTR